MSLEAAEATQTKVKGFSRFYAAQRFLYRKGGPRVEGARRHANVPAGAKEAVPGIGADLTAQVV